MKHLYLTAITLGSVAIATPFPVWAGDALIFSGVRSQPDPAALSKATKEGLDLKKVTPVDPTHIERNSLPTTRDPRADRRARNARIEGKDWVSFDKGELNARDEEQGQFGIRSLDGPLSEEELLLEKAENATRAGQPRLTSKLSRLPSSRLEGKAAPARRPATDSESDKGRAFQGQASGKSSKEGEAKTTKDLDLGSLLAPGKANSLAPPEKSPASWGDLFGGERSSQSSAEMAQREDSKSAEGFRTQAPALTAAPATAPDPLKFRSELNGRPVEAPSIAPPENFGRGFNPLAPSRNSLAPMMPSAPTAGGFDRPPVNSSATLFQDPLARANGLSPVAPPPPATPAYPSYGQPSSAPARSSSGFNSLPTRPGYGR